MSAKAKLVAEDTDVHFSHLLDEVSAKAKLVEKVVEDVAITLGKIIVYAIMTISSLIVGYHFIISLF